MLGLKLSLFVFLFAALNVEAAELKLDFDKVKIVMDCRFNGATKFYYKLGEDVGSYRAEAIFYEDDYLPEDCKQSSGVPYVYKQLKFHRAHLISRVAFDDDKSMVGALSRLANVVPMSASLHRGVWSMTEELEELLREIGGVTVWGGVEYMDDLILLPQNINMAKSFWKVIWLTGTEHVWGFYFPNNSSPTRKNIHTYLRPIHWFESSGFVDIPEMSTRIKYLKKVSVPEVTSLGVLE